MPIHKAHLTSLGFAALLACAIPAMAQELQGIVGESRGAVGAEADPHEQLENRYRIGIDCGPAPEMLRVHLRLPEDSGLLVNSVMDGSPADAAGIKRFDLITDANGKRVASVSDLVRAVNKSADQAMELSIIRRGEEKVVSVTPEERDEEEVRRLRRGFANRLGRGWRDFDGFDDFSRAQEEFRRAAEEMRRFGAGTGWQGFGPVFGPGIVVDDQDDQQSLPGELNLSVQVERSNNGPVKIKVRRGSDTWEITEDELDELPDDVRPMVENMLSGKRAGFGFMTPGTPRFRPSLPRGLPGNNRRNSNERLQERFDGLELRMEELQKAIQSIQGDN